MLVILNAPPNTGKDVLGKLLQQRTQARLASFKYKIMQIAQGILGSRDYGRLQQDLSNRVTKEMPQKYLGGITPRQFLIRISESWIKPLFGEGFFGEAVAEQLEADHPLYVFTDGGFEEEVDALSKADRRRFILVIQLIREGCTFEGDSRNYIYPVAADEIRTVVLEDGKIEEGYQAVLGIIKEHLPHWRVHTEQQLKQQEANRNMSSIFNIPEDHLDEMFSEEVMQEAEARREAQLTQDEQPIEADNSCEGGGCIL